MKNNFEYLEKGLYSIQSEWDTFKTQAVESAKSWIQMEYIGIADRIFSESKNYTVSEVAWVTNINLEKWLYVFQFEETGKKYQINTPSLQIEQNTPGTFIINTLWKNTSEVFSLSASNKLFLVHSWERKRKIDIYPHVWIKYNPKQIRGIDTKTDRYRLEQLFTFFYISESFLTNDGIINEKVLKPFKLEEWTVQYLTNLFKFIQYDLVKKNTVIDELKDSRFFSLPWSQYIESYYALFLNNKKKSLYYKNIILKELSLILKEEKVSNTKARKIDEKLQQIEKLSKKDRDFMSQLITYYYKNTLLSNPENIYSRINMKNVLIKEQWASSQEPNHLALWLNFSYFAYDIEQSDKLYYNLEQYFHEYIPQLLEVVKKDEDEFWEIEDFLYFTKNILLSDPEVVNDYSKNIVEIFTQYVELSILFYKQWTDTMISTGLHDHENVLSNMEDLIYNAYFEKERSEDKLLIRRDNPTLNFDIYTGILHKKIWDLLDFYNTKKYLVQWTKKQIVRSMMLNYMKMKINYDDYYLAISNYDAYVYAKTNQNTSWTDKDEKKVLLDKDSSIKFLEGFRWIYLWNAEILAKEHKECFSGKEENQWSVEIENASCFIFKNVIVEWENPKKLNFYFYPDKWNTINFIEEEKEINETKQWIPLSETYNLDEYKIIYKEKYQAAEQEEKDRFVFNKFFQHIFTDKTNNQSTWGPGDDTFTPVEKDPVIESYKRNKLLGERWAFSKITNFVRIIYDNVEVVRSWKDYNVHIKDLIIPISSNETNIRQDLEFEFTSDYVTDEWYFKNILMKARIERWTDSYIHFLWNNDIQIKENIELLSLEKQLTKIGEKVSIMQKIYKVISQTYSLTELKIQYEIKSDKITFEFLNENDTMQINTTDWESYNIQWNDSIFENNSYSDIQKILLKLQ